MLHADRQLLKECRRGHLARVQRLVDGGADVNCRGSHGHSPLLVAASQGHREVVAYLLAAGADATQLANDKAPTLFYACVRGHSEIVDLLLGAGANPNARRDTDGPPRAGDSAGVSLLHVAIGNRNARIVAALLRAGANRDFVLYGKDALGAALETGDAAIIRLVRQGGSR